MKATQLMYRALAGFASTASSSEFWSRRKRAAMIAPIIVRAFYLLLAFILVDRYSSWNQWLQIKSMHLLWPVLWFEVTGVRLGVIIVLTLSLLGALAAFARPDVRWWRMLAAAGVLEFAGFFNSFGVVNHG